MLEADGIDGQAACGADEPALSPEGLPLPGFGDGHLLTDRRGVILEANAESGRLLRTRPEFLVGKPFPLYLAEADWPLVYGLLSRLGHGPGALLDCRMRLRTRSGAGPGAIRLGVAAAGAGAGARLRWLLRDLGQDGLAERALEAERAFADTLLDAAPAIALVIDSHGRTLRCNPAAVAAAGRPARDILGRDWTLLLPAADRHAARVAAHDALHLDRRGAFSGGLLSAGGEPRAVAWSVQGVGLAGGRAALALGHDVTELHQAQQRALDAERLATLGQVAATLAHESRNLLQSSAACLERLSWRVQDDPQALELLKRAEAARSALARLFDDAQRHAAPLSLSLAECDLPELWREVWAEVLAASPGREATLEEEGCAALRVPADRFRLGQVFRNILENALAASPDPARVRVACRDDGQEMRMSFRDNGPGLGAEQRKGIFEPFYTTKARGTGLGMAISRRIVEAHGGRIAVGDAVPGAEILVWLPKGKNAARPSWNGPDIP